MKLTGQILAVWITHIFNVRGIFLSLAFRFYYSFTFIAKTVRVNLIWRWRGVESKCGRVKWKGVKFPKEFSVESGSVYRFAHLSNTRFFSRVSYNRGLNFPRSLSSLLFVTTLNICFVYPTEFLCLRNKFTETLVPSLDSDVT